MLRVRLSFSRAISDSQSNMDRYRCQEIHVTKAHPKYSVCQTNWKGTKKIIIEVRVESLSNFLRPRSYPLTTAMGLSLATFLDMPAPCTTSTTREISL